MIAAIRKPKVVDLQRALAFIAASVRGDELAITTLWDGAVEEGRALMLCLALTTLAKQPELMADLLGDDLATNPVTMVNLARVTGALAAMDDWPDDDDGDPDVN